MHETNNPINDLVLVAVGFSLQIWRHCLYGVHFDVFTNHNGQQYMFSQKLESLSEKVVRIIERLWNEHPL